MGFRTSSSGGSGARGKFGGAATGAAPFSQAQILHLMKTEFARGRRYGTPVACVIMQVDRLRSLTDIHGSEFNEKVQTELARLVSESTRGADQLGMISDGRYLLVLPHTDQDQAMVVAERIGREFRKLEVRSKGSVLVLTLSFGIVGSRDRDTLFFDTMLSRAEAALERAKNAGGDRVEVFREVGDIGP
jgi:diguanylate cyclase (GGDEF)-like protein